MMGNGWGRSVLRVWSLKHYPSPLPYLKQKFMLNLHFLRCEVDRSLSQTGGFKVSEAGCAAFCCGPVGSQDEMLSQTDGARFLRSTPIRGGGNRLASAALDVAR